MLAGTTILVPYNSSLSLSENSPLNCQYLPNVPFGLWLGHPDSQYFIKVEHSGSEACASRYTLSHSPSAGSELVMVCTNVSISLIDMEVVVSNVVDRGARESVSGV